MIQEPLLKPTAAMRRVMVHHTWRETNETLIRRWQVKWKATGPSLLAATRRERVRITLPAVPTEPAWVLADRIMKQVEDSPLNRMVKQLEKQVEDSPFMRMAKQIEDSPLMRMAKEIEDSTLMRMVKQIEDSSMAKFMRDVRSPSMKQFLQPPLGWSLA